MVEKLAIVAGSGNRYEDCYGDIREYKRGVRTGWSVTAIVPFDAFKESGEVTVERASGNRGRANIRSAKVTTNRNGTALTRMWLDGLEDPPRAW